MGRIRLCLIYAAIALRYAALSLAYAPSGAYGSRAALLRGFLLMRLLASIAFTQISLMPSHVLPRVSGLPERPNTSKGTRERQVK